MSVTTNGAMLCQPLPEGCLPATGSVGKWLIDHNVGMLLSFDGPPEIQNTWRPLKNGSESFDLVMSGLEYIKTLSPQYASKLAFRATIGGDYDKVSIKDRLVFFNELIRLGYGSRIHLEPAYTLKEDDGVSLLATIREQYYEAADWYLSEIKSGKRTSWYEIDRILSRLIRKSPSRTLCGAGVCMECLGVDGTIYACHRTAKGEVGHSDTGIDPEKMKEWSNIDASAINECGVCPMRFACVRGCRWENNMDCGSTHIVSPFMCSLQKLRLAVSVYIYLRLDKESVRFVHGAIQRPIKRKRVVKNV